MTFSQCVQCHFNVRFNDQHCANCGLLYPLQPLEILKNDYSGLVAIVVVATLFICAIYFGNVAGFGGIICCSLPVGIFLAAFFGSISKAISDVLSNRSLKAGENRLAHRKVVNPESLLYRDNVIKQRISELHEREQQVAAVLKKLSKDAEVKWEQVRSALSGTTQTVRRQIAQYRSKSVEIELLRVQNRLAPLIYGMEKLSYAEIDQQLNLIEKIGHQLANIRRQLDQQLQVLGHTSETTELSQRISGLEESMKKLRDA